MISSAVSPRKVRYKVRISRVVSLAPSCSTYLFVNSSRFQTQFHQFHSIILPLPVLSLISREIIFEEFQPMSSQYLNVTDGQTNGQTTCHGNTALCIASRVTIIILMTIIPITMYCGETSRTNKISAELERAENH